MNASVALAGRPKKWTMRGVETCSRERQCPGLVEGKEHQGFRDEERDSLLEIPFDPCEGLHEDVGQLWDSQGRISRSEIRTFSRKDLSRQETHGDNDRNDEEDPDEEIAYWQSREHSEDNAQLG